jgi:methylenetetrahydrofolate dehydrogenase (NADP+)/methenyltetrahydrofolate cyclohydrolase
MIIDGKAISSQIQHEIKGVVEKIQGRKPCLAVILVGDNSASRIYVKRKTEACEFVGITSIRKEFPSTISEKELLHEVDLLNRDAKVDGILIQLPLPSHIRTNLVMLKIDPNKDVDGFHPVNMGKLLIGETDGFFPCTPLGIKVLLERTGVQVEGKHAVVIGRSTIVGKPMAAMLMQNTPGCNATVTVAHSKTKNLAELCRQADILIAAIGKPHTITKDMVKDRAVVIDVGINRLEDHLVGDVDFNEVKDKCSFITPVPGGVGPMTIAMLLSNTLKSFQKRQ